MKCPLCDYPQYCPCESCLDRLPKGFNPWVWDKDGEYVNCANCGLYLHADGWLDIEYEQYMTAQPKTKQGGDDEAVYQ